MRNVEVKPGDLVQVPKSVRLFQTFVPDGQGGELGGSFLDKEESFGFAIELAIVVSTTPATLLFFVGDHPRWRWIWPGNERLLVKESP